jgi:hypothetical protein
MKRMTKAEVLKRYRNDHPDQMRFEARCAYLDGRTAFAKEMNRRANVLANAAASASGSEKARA